MPNTAMAVNTDSRAPTSQNTLLNSLGQSIRDTFEEYQRHRTTMESQWLKNYRQYRGIYDPEILQEIPAGFSKSYPKITRAKVIGLLARMMEMLFPTSERNWVLKPTPVPNIPEQDLNQILSELQQALQQQAMEQAQAQQGGQPAPPPVLDDETIEKAIMQWAKERADKMVEEMDDQLRDIEFIDLAKKVIKSTIIYGIGILRGPMVKTYKKRSWKQNEAGQYVAVVNNVKRPYFEFVSVWDYYPDYGLRDLRLSEWHFERHLMTRHEVYSLTKRSDFFKRAILKYLTDNQQGNYSESSADQQLRTLNSTGETTPERTSKLFELIQCVGFVNGRKLREVGYNIKDADLEKDVLVDIWMLGSTVIKVSDLPYDDQTDFYHTFIFDEEVEGTSIGATLPENIRDSQMSVCASARMLMDNASITAGPIFEINKDLMAPGQTYSIHAFKTFYREGEGQMAQYPAVRQLNFNSHSNELMSIMNLFRELMDEESMLPKWAMGAGSGAGSERFRTVGGASMIFGAANMTIKDVVRQFDKFMMSVIKSLYKWNMLFNQRQDIRGDYQTITLGASSLVAKEMRATALDQMQQTMDPEDKIYLKRRNWLKERLKVRDLPIDELLLDEAEAEAALQANSQAAEAMRQSEKALNDARAKKLLTAAGKEIVDMQAKGELTEAQVQEIMSRVEKNIAEVDDKDRTARMNLTRLIMDLSGNEEQPGRMGVNQLLGGEINAEQ